MSSSNIPGYSAFQTDVSTILRQLVAKINGYVTSLAANPATKPAPVATPVAPIAPVATPAATPIAPVATPIAPVATPIAPVAPVATPAAAPPAAQVAPPPGLTPQQAENFTKLPPGIQEYLAKAPLGMQQMVLNTMGAAIARGFTSKQAAGFTGSIPPPMQEKLAAFPIETQNKLLDAVLASLTAGEVADAAKGTPEYDKLFAESMRLNDARLAIFEETGLTPKRRAPIQPAPLVQSVQPVSPICGTLGKPSADGKIRIYTRDECEGTLKGVWHEGGECTKGVDGSYSYDCRYLNTLPESQRGGRRTKRVRKMKLRKAYKKTSRKA